MQVVIVGGGFAGIKSALELCRRGFGDITLVSDQPYFLNRSTLHKVASLEDESASVIPLDDLLADYPSIKLVHGRLASVDPERRYITCRSKKIYYDKLILALATTTDFTTKGAKLHSFDTEVLSHLRRLRQHLFSSLNGPQASDEVYTIVGGGLTGVELAGSLASYVNQLKNSPTAKNNRIAIGLIEKQNRLLPNFSKTAGKQAKKRLEALGVSVITGQTVKQVDKDTVRLNNQTVPSNTAIWATGTINNQFYQDNSAYFNLDKHGNVLVNSYLEAYQDIHVLGDSTAIHSINQAHNAIDMGVYIADHFARLVSGRGLQEFKPRQHLVTISIGDDWAYAEHRRIYSTGWFGHKLHYWQSISNYRQIMSKSRAAKTWNNYSSNQSD